MGIAISPSGDMPKHRVRNVARGDQFVRNAPTRTHMSLKIASDKTEHLALKSDVRLLYTARCLRGFGDGFAVIILPAYLSALGFNPIEIGLVATASLLGTAVFTLLIGLIAPRHDLRNMLLLGAALVAFTGIAFPSSEHLILIGAVAFIGTINPSTGDIGVLVPLEHALLARSVG